MLARSRTRDTWPRLSSSIDAPSHDGPRTRALSTIGGRRARGWRHCEALRAEEAALTLHANDPAALNGQGLLLVDQGKSMEAAASFDVWRRAILRTRPIGRTLDARRERQDPAAAESAYRRALEADAAYPDAANGLGVLLVQQGRAADAIPWFERALEHSSEFYEAQLNLGIVYQESGNSEKARSTYRGLLASAPPRFARERRAATDLLNGLR